MILFLHPRMAAEIRETLGVGPDEPITWEMLIALQEQEARK